MNNTQQRQIVDRIKQDQRVLISISQKLNSQFINKRTYNIIQKYSSVNMNFLLNQLVSTNKNKHKDKIIYFKTQQSHQHIHKTNHRLNNLIHRQNLQLNKKNIQNLNHKSQNQDKSISSLDNVFIKSDKKITNLIFNFQNCKDNTNHDHRKFNFQKRYKKKILPHLIKPQNNQIAQNSTVEDSTKRDVINNNKMLDLIIDILKDPNKNASGDLKVNNKTLITPINNFGRSFLKFQRFNTDTPTTADILKDQYEQKSRKKYKTPKVIQNEILKHSTNLNVIRKKLFSEHRNRQQNKSRNNLKSSQNQRFKFEKKTSNEGQLWNGNQVQLLTFYPKDKQKEDLKCVDNEFISIDKIQILSGFNTSKK